MSQSCENCTHRDNQGFCRWADGMPPALQNIFSALNAEPATHIDWEDLMNSLHPVSDDDWCNQFQPSGEDQG